MGSSCSSGIKFHLCKMNSSSKLLHKRAYAAAKSLQSCPILCDPIDGKPPGFPSLGFSRQEHWSGLPFPSPMRESESETEVAQSCQSLATPWTAAYQAPPSMGFSRQFCGMCENNR